MRIALANMKGGVGKTTSAMNLAEALVVSGEPVQVHDLDPQAGATKWRRIAKQLHRPLPFIVEASNGEALMDLDGGSKLWDLLDAAPSGPGLDAALRYADFVIVPSSDSPNDIQQTWSTLSLLNERRVPAAVLLCRVEPRTRAFRQAVETLDGKDAPRFETVIEKRQELKAGPARDLSMTGATVPRLFGYGQVLRELKEAVGR